MKGFVQDIEDLAVKNALRTLDGQVVDQPKYRKLIRRAEIFKKIAGGRHGGSVPLQ